MVKKVGPCNFKYISLWIGYSFTKTGNWTAFGKYRVFTKFFLMLNAVVLNSFMLLLPVMHTDIRNIYF